MIKLKVEHSLEVLQEWLYFLWKQNILEVRKSQLYTLWELPDFDRVIVW